MTSMEDMRVLSIQSHVVHGYVGNRCAVFPLQTLGLEVDVINSVDFSNHTGYGLVKGRVLSDMELGELIQGLMANGVANYTHLLTGYVGCPRFLRRIVSVVGELRKLNPDLVYLCDPVLGDNGQLYVPESLLPIYIEEVIPLATIVTPNQYEAELLSGITITTRADAIRVLDFFHEKGVSIVIISSTDLLSPDTLLLLASQKNGEKKEQIEIAFPCLESSFTGTGDTFAAIFLAFYSSKGDFKLALELTVGCMQEILKRTLSYAKKLAGEGREPTKKELELRLIQSRDDILNPKGYPGTSIILS
ncbi:unnamed protein product [Darwinula stevensoni]|uniref:Pyridoxal kinase n=1 Tax=Darwinula stevensoni TaxID=69355 RepID=A0A7R9A5J7_9CRUS|nr:unnamed protein product [Darwinula stevensoni]CAG0895663.1 unnamed protein product [Darwinula stevensoni]